MSRGDDLTGLKPLKVGFTPCAECFPAVLSCRAMSMQQNLPCYKSVNSSRKQKEGKTGGTNLAKEIPSRNIRLLYHIS